MLKMGYWVGNSILLLGEEGPHGHGTLSEHVCITFHCQSRECISNRKNKTLPWPWCLCRRAQLHGPNFLFLRDFFCPSFQVILLLSTLLFFFTQISTIPFLSYNRYYLIFLYLLILFQCLESPDKIVF